MYWNLYAGAKNHAGIPVKAPKAVILIDTSTRTTPQEHPFLPGYSRLFPAWSPTIKKKLGHFPRHHCPPFPSPFHRKLFSPMACANQNPTLPGHNLWRCLAVGCLRSPLSRTHAFRVRVKTRPGAQGRDAKKKDACVSGIVC